MSKLTWRGGQAYLALLAVASLAAAIWIHHYWNRGERAGIARSRLVERLPTVLAENVHRNGAEGVVETPAIVFWVIPFTLPVVAVAAGAAFLGLRRRHRWALAATVIFALMAFPVLYGGSKVLRGLEDRHYYAKSSYVRTYRVISIPLLAGSMAILATVGVDGVLTWRRRSKPDAAR
jgi:hypothetical protein